MGPQIGDATVFLRRDLHDVTGAALLGANDGCGLDRAVQRARRC